MPTVTADNGSTIKPDNGSTIDNSLKKIYSNTKPPKARAFANANYIQIKNILDMAKRHSGFRAHLNRLPYVNITSEMNADETKTQEINMKKQTHATIKHAAKYRTIPNKAVKICEKCESTFAEKMAYYLHCLVCQYGMDMNTLAPANKSNAYDGSFTMQSNSESHESQPRMESMTHHNMTPPKRSEKTHHAYTKSRRC
eukprot:866075_1